MNIFALSMPAAGSSTSRCGRQDRESPMGDAMAGVVYYDILAGLTNQQIGVRHGLSPVHVSRIRRKAVYKALTDEIDNLHAENDAQALQGEDDK